MVKSRSTGGHRAGVIFGSTGGHRICVKSGSTGGHIIGGISGSTGVHRAGVISGSTGKGGHRIGVKSGSTGGRRILAHIWVNWRSWNRCYIWVKSGGQLGRGSQNRCQTWVNWRSQNRFTKIRNITSRSTRGKRK